MRPRLSHSLSAVIASLYLYCLLFLLVFLIASPTRAREKQIGCSRGEYRYEKKNHVPVYRFSKYRRTGTNLSRTNISHIFTLQNLARFLKLLLTFPEHFEKYTDFRQLSLLFVRKMRKATNRGLCPFLLLLPDRKENYSRNHHCPFFAKQIFVAFTSKNNPAAPRPAAPRPAAPRACESRNLIAPPVG